MDGAVEAVLQGLDVQAGGWQDLTHAVGVNVKNGGLATIRGGLVAARGGSISSIGVRAVGSRVSLQGSASARGNALVAALWLERAAGSSVTQSTLNVESTAGNSDAPDNRLFGVRALGASDGIVVNGSTINAGGYIDTMGDAVADAAGVSFEDCAGGAVRVSGSTIRVSATPRGIDPLERLPTDGVRVLGDCAAHIEDNHVESVGGQRQSGATGAIVNNAVHCGPSGLVPAACTVVGNDPLTTWKKGAATPGTPQGASTGISCEGGSCVLVSHNRVVALQQPVTMRAVFYQATGIAVSGSTLVRKNNVTAGCATRGVGIHASGGARVENNLARGSTTCDYPSPYGGFLNGSSIGLVADGADVHSNLLDGAGYEGFCGVSRGATASGASILRNNQLQAGICGPVPGGGDAYGLVLSSSTAVLETNAFHPGATALVGRPGNPPLDTIEEVNALAGTSVFGNFIRRVASDLFDAGTTAGAPPDDYVGNPRGATPDVGPYENTDLALPDPCTAVTCSGHGTCERVGRLARCSCDSGYAFPPEDPTRCEAPEGCELDNGGCDPVTTCYEDPNGIVCGDCPTGYTGTGQTGCDDIDECQTGNGGCDPLTTCTNVPGGRSCGDCPDGYAGSGELGCVEVGSCDPNPCQNGGTCSESAGVMTCDCPPGVNGVTCELVFTELTGTRATFCGLLSDGRATCWGATDLGQAMAPGGVFTGLASASIMVCGTRSDGSAECWGYGPNVLPPPTASFERLTVASDHACGLLSGSRSVLCWGADTGGQTLAPAGAFLALSAGSFHTCGIRESDRSILCWGLEGAGSQFDRGQKAVPAGAYREVAASTFGTCALRTDGQIVCAGKDLFDQSIVPPSGSFSTFRWNGHFGCAIDANGALTCFGEDAYGTGSPPGGAYTTLGITDYSACAVRGDNAVVCWGRDEAGLLTPPTNQP